jgi:hypothetical protein
VEYSEAVTVYIEDAGDVTLALSELDDNDLKESDYEPGTTGKQARPHGAALPHLCFGFGWSHFLGYLRKTTVACLG